MSRWSLLLMVALLAACTSRPPTEAALEAAVAGPVPDQESWGARFDVTDGFHPRLRMWAPYMAKYITEDSTYIHMVQDSVRVRVLLYDAEGDSSATVDANELFYFEADRRFEARGRVIVETVDGKTLESEHLLWLEEDRKIRTPGFVVITTPDRRVQGYELVADEDLLPYEIKRVTGTFTVEDR
ncbi:MAG: LPS export ABC transporter periplasmic protein LptC [Rhodothermales bacterium]